MMDTLVIKALIAISEPTLHKTIRIWAASGGKYFFYKYNSLTFLLIAKTTKKPKFTVY